MSGALWLDKLLSLTLPPLPTTSRWYQPLFIVGLILLGLGIAWLPPLLTVLLLGGAVFAFFLLQKPLLALYLLIPTIPFSSLLSVSLGGFNVGLMEMLLAAALLAWLLRLLTGARRRGERLRLAQPPAYLFLPLALFLGSVLLSWLTAFSLSASLVETAKWVEVLALYLFIINLLPADHIKWLVLAILLTGVAQAALGLYQFIFKIGPAGFLLFDGRFLRAYGTFAQPNPYAGYLGLVLPLALALSLWGLFERGLFKQISPSGPPQGREKIEIPTAGRRGGAATGHYGKIDLLIITLAVASLGLLLAGLFASQSRGGWLAFAGAATATLIVSSKRPQLLLATLVTGVALVGLVGAFDWRFIQPGAEPAAGDTALGAVTQRFVEAARIATIDDIAPLEVTDANFATLERLAHWQAAREMWRDHLWLGVGFGNYAAIYPAYAVGRWLDPLGHAHNYPLNLGAETGLVGISGYLIFWIATFGVLWAAVRRSRGFYRAVAAGSFGIVVHLHIHNLFDNLYVQGMYLHIATILAIISIIYDQADDAR